MATMNLAAGIVIASWPERQADLETMLGWGGAWLKRGGNIYLLELDWPDYPPHAIVVLSTLSALPPGWAVPTWAGLNLAMALVVSYLAVRVVRPQASLSEAAVPILMFLCWGGFRALLQFSLLALLFSLLSMDLAGRKPIWSGICLGLALMKPQISIPFFLWALFTRQLRSLGAALAVVVAGFGVYCLRVGADPVEVVARYGEILRQFYTGNAIMLGLAQLRPVIGLVATNFTIVDAIALTLALMMLAIVCAIGFAEAKSNRRVLYAAPPLAAVWSLLTFYHLTYGFLILLPLAATLLFDNDSSTQGFRRRLFWMLQLSMMFDLTVLWRWFGHLAPALAAAGPALDHADRIIMIGFFVSVAILAVRRMKTDRSPSSQTAL